jgi:hypothetical protein
VTEPTIRVSPGSLRLLRVWFVIARLAQWDGIVRSNRGGSWHSEDLAEGTLERLARCVMPLGEWEPIRAWWVHHGPVGHTTWHMHAPEADYVSVTAVFGVGSLALLGDDQRATQIYFRPGENLWFPGTQKHRAPPQEQHRASLVINWRRREP